MFKEWTERRRAWTRETMQEAMAIVQAGDGKA